MPFPNQVSCQSRKTAKNGSARIDLGDFANQELVGFTKARFGTFARSGASNPTSSRKEGWRMLGKLAGARLGGKVAGESSGAKGAMLGYGAATLARRSVPALAAITLGGSAFRKWRERRNSRAPVYPSEAAPSSPSD
jgi:hypothetical protein